MEPDDLPTFDPQDEAELAEAVGQMRQAASAPGVAWGWFVGHDQEGIPHRVPSLDMWAHRWVDCRCGPVYDGTGIIHAAFDGREAYEAGTRKRN